MRIKRKSARKFLAILANVSLLFNSFLPLLLTAPAVFAQDATTTPSVVFTPTPEPTISSEQENSQTTSDEPVESAESTNISVPPTEDPTPEPTEKPIITPELPPPSDITPDPSAEPTSPPTGGPTGGPTSQPELTPTIDPVNSQIGTLTPTTEITPVAVGDFLLSPTPTESPEIVCLTDEQIRDTTNQEWIIDDVAGISETINKVELGVRYVYPQENKVSVTFKCLPADENLRTTLKIQKVKTADLNLPDTMGNVGEYAYDITTGMTNGTFEYDVTLPKPENSTAEISYIEKSLDDATNNEIKVEEVKLVEESKTEQSSNTVKATSLDHFTIFIASTHEGELSSGGFIGGNITTYSEGDVINFRFNVSSNGAGSGTIEVRFTGQESACLFFIDSFSLGSIEGISGAIPIVTTLGSITQDDDEWVQIIQVNYTSAGESIINYTLTLSDEAGTCSGSSQHTRLGNATGDFKNTGAQNVPIPAQNVIVLPDIIVTKGLDENGDGNIDRYANAGEWSFTLNGNITLSTDETGKVIFENVSGGSHTITETGPEGYAFLEGSGDCIFNSDGTATLDFTATTDTTDKYCVFTNTLQRSNLTLVKNIVNDNGGNALVTDWTLSATGPTNISGITGNAAVTNAQVTNGTYTLAESSGPSGYTAGDWTCTNSVIVTDKKITLSPGQSTTCTITNDDIAPHLKLIKSIDNQYNGPFSVTQWTLSATGSIMSFSGTGTVEGDVQAGVQYTLTESGPTGTIASPWSCDGGSLSDGNKLVLGPGDDVSCMITNTAEAGTLIVVKEVINNNGGTLLAEDFSFKVNNGADTPFEVDGQNNIIVDNGVYTVVENSTPGYTTSYSNCSNVTIPNGGSATCTITNNDQPGTLIIKKIVNGGTKTADDFSFSYNQTGSITFEADGQNDLTVPAGTYTVVEAPDSEYNTTYNNCTSVSVANGGSATCTITNTRKTGRLSVDKVVTGVSQSLWNFTVKSLSGQTLGTLFDDGTHYYIDLETGQYTVTESNNVLGYSLIGVGGVCSGLNGLTANATVGEGTNNTCIFRNSRDMGYVRVHKQVDLNADGDYNDVNEADNNYANSLGFLWQLNGGSSWMMGTSSPSTPTTIPGVSHSITETMPPGYHYTGYSLTGNCNSGRLTTYPIPVTISKDQTIAVTLCNARDSGTIRIYKDTYPTNDPQSFSFTGTTPIGTFILDDNTANSTYPNFKSFTLPIGSYSVTEDAYPGWGTLTNLVCTGDANGSVNLASRTATINLDINEVVNCIFTNNKHATLTLNKIISGGSATLANFTPKIDGVNVTWGNPIIVSPTNHQASESMGITGYTASDWSGNCNTLGWVGFNPGDNKTCTITNTRDTGDLQITKLIDADGDLATTDDRTPYQGWVMDIDPDGTDTEDPSIPTTDSSGQVLAENIKTGNYWVSEDVNGPNNNYHFLDSYCTVDNVATGNSGTSSFGGVEVKKDKTTDCTFINARDTGDLIINKVIDEDGDLTTTDDQIPGDGWDFSVDGINFIDSYSPTTDTTGTANLSALKTGEYAISETVTPGYEQISWSCDRQAASDLFTVSFLSILPTQNLLIEHGLTTTCTFYNTPNGAIHGYKWSDQDNSGTLNNEEPLLPDWTINLYRSNGDGGFETSPFRSMDTDSSQQHLGWYWFEHLFPGEYKICEVPQTGWTQTSSPICHTINLPSGSNTCSPSNQDNAVRSSTECNFGNIQFGSVEVVKFNDIDGDGQYNENTEETLSGWTINLTGKDSKVTDNKGVIFDELLPDTYFLSENIQPGWDQTNIYCLSDSDPTPTTNPTSTITPTITVTPTTTITPTLTATPTPYTGGLCHYNFGKQEWNALSVDVGNPGHIGDEHENDYAYNGPRDANGHPSQDPHNPTDPNTDGDAWCKNNFRESTLRLVKPIIAVTQVNNDSNNHQIDLTAGQNVQCFIGNKYVKPQLTISKFNNRWPTVQTNGSEVKYTITLKVSENNIKDVSVVDLPPLGFKFITGSHEVLVNGNLRNISPPVYSSPGTWDIGNLNEGDEVTLTYLATIQNSVDPGTYKDVAWAYGCQNSTDCSLESEDQLLAQAIDPGYLATVFVGTKIKIDPDIPGQSHEGQVLGASTELPATGASTVWMIVFIILSTLGLSTLFYGVKPKRKNMAKNLILIILFSLFSLIPAKAAFAAQSPNIYIGLENPITPTNQDNFSLTFSTLDILGRPLTVKCFKVNPDSSEVQIGADIAIIPGGNSGNCNLENDRLSESGKTYYFYTIAYADGESYRSDSVAVDYNTSGPGTPANYQKDQEGTCRYKISFEASNDGKTTRIEIYRSDQSSFVADSGSKIGEVGISPGQKGSFTDVNVPDCQKTYYYVIRAFDSALNGSSLAGDYITAFIDTSSDTTSSVFRAIPIIGDDNIPLEEDTDQADEVDQDIDESGEGTVLGSEDKDYPTILGQALDFVKNNLFISVLGAILLLVIIRYGLKKVSNKKR